MNLSIKQYLTEKSSELNAELLSNENLLITAPTDSGKTFAIIQFALKHKHKKIAFLMPTQNLVRNVESNYSDKHLSCGYGKQFAKDSKFKNFICTTYDSFSFFDVEFDIVIIDEAHFLAGHGRFRTEVLCNLLSTKSKKVLLTGTPEIIEHLANYKTIQFTRKIVPKQATIIESFLQAKTHALNLINNRDKSKLTIIRINNKNTIDEVFEVYKNSHNIVKLYSDTEAVQYAEQDSKTLDSIRSGNVPKDVDVILCTSILDAGISLSVQKDVDCFALSDMYMPNAIDVVQLYARVRTNSAFNMSLTIIGFFGSNKLGSCAYINEAPTVSQLVKRMSGLYAEYIELDEESYFGLLDYYGIRVNQCLEDDYNINEGEYLSKLRPIQIVKNLQNFPIRYHKLSEQLSTKRKEDLLQYFTGDKVINSNESSTVVRIFERIELAIQFNIHPSIFVDNSYHEKRLNNLINAVDYFNNSKNFKNVMFDLLEGYYLEHGTNHKMNLTAYNELSDTHQESIKAVAKLLFNGRLWNRNTITLKRLDTTPEIDEYFNNFLWAFQSQSLAS